MTVLNVAVGMVVTLTGLVSQVYAENITAGDGSVHESAGFQLSNTIIAGISALVGGLGIGIFFLAKKYLSKPADPIDTAKKELAQLNLFDAEAVKAYGEKIKTLAGIDTVAGAAKKQLKEIMLTLGGGEPTPTQQEIKKVYKIFTIAKAISKLLCNEKNTIELAATSKSSLAEANEAVLKQIKSLTDADTPLSKQMVAAGYLAVFETKYKMFFGIVELMSEQKWTEAKKAEYKPQIEQLSQDVENIVAVTKDQKTQMLALKKQIGGLLSTIEAPRVSTPISPSTSPKTNSPSVAAKVTKIAVKEEDKQQRLEDLIAQLSSLNFSNKKAVEAYRKAFDTLNTNAKEMRPILAKLEEIAALAEATASFYSRSDTIAQSTNTKNIEKEKSAITKKIAPIAASKALDDLRVVGANSATSSATTAAGALDESTFKTLRDKILSSANLALYHVEIKLISNEIGRLVANGDWTETTQKTRQARVNQLRDAAQEKGLKSQIEEQMDAIQLKITNTPFSIGEETTSPDSSRSAKKSKSVAFKEADSSTAN